MVEAFLSYSGSRLSDAHAVNVAATFSQVLSEILADPSRSFAEIELVHLKALEQLFGWNSDYPQPVNECVGTLFQGQVHAHPTKLAVQSSDDSFTYEELAALSTRLARHLQMRGIGPEVIVLLCFPKSAWAVVAMMAVVQAGGTILFLDASHPTARLQEIQSQVNSKLILSAPQYADMWGWTGAEVFAVDRASVTGLPLNKDVPASKVTPSNTLYVIFTSGSTGKPKGCVIEHRQFLTGSLAQQRESGMVHTDRVLQLASFTFDVSILEIITSLISGACVCIPGDEARAKGPASCIQEFEITWAFLTPSLVKLMAPEMVPNLRFLVLGGEALSKENVETWAPHLQLANGYGPTECSIAATGNKKLDPNTDPANIGRGLGAVCWIVDPENHKRLVPIGAPGELLVQGPIVARGYFNDPEKTEAAFVEDFPWLPVNGHPRRMYKTGDLARYNSDGTINFIGRKDSQVKLRGLRIELGEIEHHIAVHPMVQQAVVLLPRQGLCKNKLTVVLSLKDFHNSESNGLQLVAQDGSETVTKAVGIVTDDISKHLPGYMMPTVWAVVESVPLTTSSKQNRVMVAKWVVNMDAQTYTAISSLDDADGPQEAATPMEEQLQELCSIVLGVSPDQVRLNRSFVNNGGDSIMAMQLMGRWRLEGVAISIQDVLRSKTLSELAERAINGSTTEEFDGTLEYDMEKLETERLPQLGLTVQEVEEAYPLSSMQRGILLSQQRQSESYELSITCEVIIPDGQILDRKRLIAAWEAVVRRHTSLRTVFVDSITDAGLYDQVVLKSPLLDVSETQCDDEHEFLKKIQQQRISASATQPPVNFTICETAAGKVFCTVAISHALIDGVSILLLFRDLSLAYSELLPAGIQMRYSRYIGFLQSQSSETALDYWKEYLAELAPCHFPVLNDDLLEPNELHELNMEIGDESDLTSFCRKHNLTPASVFQTAWALVLKSYTSLDDVCFGYLSSGRDAPIADVGDTVGVYINMLICRLKLSPGSEVAQLVEAVQTAFLNGIPHQHCSLAEIQHGLQVQERLFNTVMSLQSVIGEVIRGTEMDGGIGFKIIGEHDPTEVCMN
jgi:amino acid adenylation domain-containing protein